jgi:hypothetical protein
VIFGTPPPVALSVSPARIVLIAPASRAVELSNVGAERVVVDITRASRDGRGAAAELLAIRPRHFVLGAGSHRVLTLRVGASGRAGPGDHQLRLLFVARPARAGRVAVRLRLGVGVHVRIPGRTVRRLDVRGLRVRPSAGARMLLVSVANAGNVTEQLRGRLIVTLFRRGRFVSRLRSRAARELYPGTHAVVPLRYRGRVRGVVIAVVKVGRGAPGRPARRRYRIRL